MNLTNPCAEIALTSSVTRYFELARLIVEDTNPDGTPEEHFATISILVRTLITDPVAHRQALLKYLPEDCV